MPLPDWWARVDRIFAQAGVPTSVWVSIAGAESTLVPWASNRKLPDDSWGLFQLNRNGGQGKGYTSDYLMDPVNNAMIAVKYIAPAVQHCGPDNISCIAVNSGHPGPVPTSDQRIKNIANYFNSVRGKSGEEAYGIITGGKIQPGPPTQGTDPIPTEYVPKPEGWPSWIPFPQIPIPHIPTGEEIGAGVSSGISSGIKGFFSGLKSGGIETAAPVAFGVAGVSLIGMGLFAAAMGNKTIRETAVVAAKTAIA